MTRYLFVGLFAMALAACGGNAGYDGEHGSSPQAAAEEAAEAVLDNAASPEVGQALAAAVRLFPQREGFNTLYLTLTPDPASFTAAFPSQNPAARSPLEISFSVVADDVAVALTAPISARLRTLVGTHMGTALLDASSLSPRPGKPTLALTVYARRLEESFQTTSTPDYTCPIFQFTLRGTLTAGGVSAPVVLEIPPPPPETIASWQSSFSVLRTAAQGQCQLEQVEAIQFAAPQLAALLLEPLDD